MVMLAEPLEKALDAVRAAGGGRVVYLSPQGRRLDHEKVVELAGRSAVTLLCGRYEGVDERLVRRRVDEELSLGDYVLAGGLLDCPQYTRPEVYAGERVPEVLLSGHHEQIRRWRLKQSLGRTWLRRPELVAARRLSAEEQGLLEEFKQETTSGVQP
jgi:tRNA (guanine37-N1)-methyltransferase